MNNKNINDIMKMLSSMDKNQLNDSLNKVSQMLKSPQADEMIKKIKENTRDENN